MKTVLITGASSGMGYQTAKLLAKSGFQVFGAARNIAPMDSLKDLDVTPIKMDVTSQASMQAGG